MFPYFFNCHFLFICIKSHHLMLFKKMNSGLALIHKLYYMYIISLSITVPRWPMSFLLRAFKIFHCSIEYFVFWCYLILILHHSLLYHEMINMYFRWCLDMQNWVFWGNRLLIPCVSFYLSLDSHNHTDWVHTITK